MNDRAIQYPLIFFFLISLTFTVPAQKGAASEKKQPNQEITAKEIIQKYIEKRGGMKRLLAIRTLMYRGEGYYGDSKLDMAMARARPYYFIVGDPKEIAMAGYAEGNDGSHWEFFRRLGLVLRTTGAPANAIRHTAYFDDGLIMSAREPGWKTELTGKESFAGTDAYKLLVTSPDGTQGYAFVDTNTWLLAGHRATAPIHAFGNPVTTETRFFDWKPVNGVLYSHGLVEAEIATNKILHKSRWNSIEANVDFHLDFFSPPEYEKTPLNRMLNSVYAARNIPVNSLGWYRDFRDNPANAGIDTSEGMGAIGFQILKTGAVETAILVLEANVNDYPNSAQAHFGLARAYSAAGRKDEAIVSYRKALRIDPNYKRASDALKELTKVRR